MLFGRTERGRSIRQLNTSEVQQVGLGLLEYVADYCAKKGYCYFLAYGTLLGAIRHEGFIPWDDDVDIAMPRKDYEEFIKSFTDKTGRYVLATYENTPGYYAPWAKVYDTRTFLEERINGAISLGVALDVFPMDNCGESLEKAKLVNSRISLYRKLKNAKIYHYSPNRKFIKNLLSLPAQILLRPIPTKKLLSKIDAIARSVSEEERYSAALVSMAYGENEIMETNRILPVSQVYFEGKSFTAPHDCDYYLKHLYNNYTTLPPIESRQSHHLWTAYWREECIEQ